MTMGGLFLLLGLPLFTDDEASIFEQIYLTVLWLVFTSLFLGYSIYLWRKRLQGHGVYWDEVGIVIDLKGNKIYWNEIEEIKFDEGYLTGIKSTELYPHYTNHETIRVRHKKIMPTTAHSLVWFFTEKPKEMHDNLIKTWRKQTVKERNMIVGDKHDSE